MFLFSDSETELDVTGSRAAGKPLAESTPAPFATRRGPKPKYHTSMTGRGVTAGTARPRFSSSSDDDDDASSNDNLSDAELASSDLDTDFSADEKSAVPTVAAPTTTKRTAKPTLKVAALRETERLLSTEEEPPVSTPTLKLKIKLPPTSTLLSTPTTEMESPKIRNAETSSKKGKSKLTSKKLKVSISGARKKTDHYGFGDNMSTSTSRKKSTDSWSKRHNDSSPSDSENDDDVGALQMDEASITNPLDNSTNDKLYCVCQCPHDDVSEMIGCDAPDCRLEWFHFECVGIMVPPKGKWFCPECSERYRIKERRSYM